MKRKEPSDNFDRLARYERGVMILLFALAATATAFVVWLGLNFLR
jgi:hypothetical protein